MTEYEIELLKIEREKLRIAKIAAYNAAVQRGAMIRYQRAAHRSANESWIDKLLDW